GWRPAPLSRRPPCAAPGAGWPIWARHRWAPISSSAAPCAVVPCRSRLARQGATIWRRPGGAVHCFTWQNVRCWCPSSSCPPCCPTSAARWRRPGSAEPARRGLCPFARAAKIWCRSITFRPFMKKTLTPASTSFLTGRLPAHWLPYVQLMRIDRPIGSLLLLWPTYWALWLAADGVPDLKNLVIFTLGVFLMRSAGCVINDYADRDFDGHVKRTQQRPLAT